METSIYLRFYIKKSKLNKKGLTPILMRVTMDSKRSEINIGRSVDPEKWKIRTNPK
ncbi:Arm DNA-binding domain-containing protein [Gillisia sp. Hel_I_86]|uniref:Arm DNA-binding domain-containing protein n=1 Tax=Gillisia sp. Hel_I_86 TaxID=1249981 RepID=UPI0021BD2A76|nr:Arm DNA-binding domain-containing protein [Gillisia sp. Hel_I_86]